MSADNVTALPGVNRVTSKPNDGLCAMLRDLLERAESGYLQSLIATGFTADGLRLSVWSDTHPNVHEMLGAIAWLQAEYIERHTGG